MCVCASQLDAKGATFRAEVNGGHCLVVQWSGIGNKLAHVVVDLLCSAAADADTGGGSAPPKLRKGPNVSASTAFPHQWD